MSSLSKAPCSNWLDEVVASVPVAPYYRDDAVVIFNADCKEIVPHMPKACLLLTDPPYGIDAAADKRGGKQHGKAAAPSRSYGASDWDKTAPARWVLDMCREHATWAVLWGGNYFDALPPARGWLVWDKDNGDNDYADCELAWTNLELAVRKFRFRWMGMLQENMAKKEPRWHPTQKPAPLLTWCIGLAGKDDMTTETTKARPSLVRSDDLLDFVFLDGASRPFRVTMYGGEPWLFYWHADGHWVTLRKVTQPEIWELQARRLPDEQSALYNKKPNTSRESR